MGSSKSKSKEAHRQAAAEEAQRQAAAAAAQRHAAAVAEAQRQAAAAEAERQRVAQERQREEAARVERERALQQREAALKAAEEARERARQRARQQAELEAAEAREREEQARRQVPAFLQGHAEKVNVAVVGNTGVGKSLFVNAVRGIRQGQPGWALVGVTETTLEPTPFEFPDEAHVLLWDIPGAGTAAFPLHDYIRTFGLRHFDVVIVLAAGRFSEAELLISSELHQASKATMLARTKVDLDIANEEADNGRAPTETKRAIREDLTQGGAPDAYLISSRQPLEHDFARLCRDLRAACRGAAGRP